MKKEDFYLVQKYEDGKWTTLSRWETREKADESLDIVKKKYKCKLRIMYYKSFCVREVLEER